MLDSILKKVQKPARYTGGEYNAPKPKLDAEIKVNFCFPDLYDIGMSNLGMRILCSLMNDREDTFCDRVFAPWIDMEAQMRENGIPLFGLDSRRPVKDGDILMFTLQYEMSYTNIINLLDLAGLPLFAKDRTTGPFVVGGGPCAYNPEPLADFFDFFVIGEGEEVTHEILDAYKAWNGTREAFLKAVSQIDGVYVPSLYDVTYHADHTIRKVGGKRVTKRIIKDFDNAYQPSKLIMPFIDIVHDRVTLEIFRGCDRGCRFCQAGMIYRPVRERSVDKLVAQAKRYLEDTGYDEISLASLSTSDYTQFPALCDGLFALTEGQNVNLSLPSLRVDNFSLGIMKRAQKVRKSGLTFAPEAGTQRLRDVINKNVTEEDLKKSVSMAFSGGWSGLKLYFMIGLPTETDEDIEGIARLAKMVADAYNGGRKLKITVSTSTFVPKPHTPFQWQSQIGIDETERRQGKLKDLLRHKWANYNWHDAQISMLEGVFARGDRRLSAVLVEAQKLGCKFDGWNECFDYSLWMQAFEKCGIDPDFYTARARGYDEVLPWDHIDCGVSKEFLIAESEKAMSAETTGQCRNGCNLCGLEGVACG